MTTDSKPSRRLNLSPAAKAALALLGIALPTLACTTVMGGSEALATATSTRGANSFGIDTNGTPAVERTQEVEDPNNQSETIGNVPGCEPLQKVGDAAPHDALGNLLVHDQRDGWDLLLPNAGDVDGNGSEDLAEAKNSLNVANCYVSQSFDAFSRGVLVEGQNITAQKWGEMQGLSVAEIAAGAVITMPMTHQNQIASLTPDYLQENRSFGLVTNVAQLSQSFVQLSEKLAKWASSMPGALTADQVEDQFFANYNMESRWNPSADPKLSDEIDVMCLTTKGPFGESRVAQPEIVVPARWEDEILPGEEKNINGVWNLSNQDGMVVSVSITGEAQLEEALKELKANNHIVSQIKLADGTVALVTVHDMRNENPQTARVLDTTGEQDNGSADQLIWCALGEQAEDGTSTPELPTQPEPDPSNTPPVTTEPAPSNTPGATETPTASLTPTFTSTPTASLTPTFTSTPTATASSAPTNIHNPATATAGIAPTLEPIASDIP